MSKISIYEVVPVPKLADKLVGTSVGGDPEDITYNFTLSELLNLFIPNIPGNTLQGVLDFGNTATQNINLTGIITTTTLNVGSTANILNSNLTGQTHITGGLYDRLNSIGTAGQVLTSTGTQVEWYTIPTVIPNLQQVLTAGNTAVNNIILTGNLSANNAALLTSTISTSLTLLGTLRDGLSSVGANNQVLSSNVTGVRWVNLPVYSATSPLLYNSGTGVFSIQQANASQNGYLSSADWITFDGKQTSISLTTIGNSGASTFVGATINVPNYTLAGLGGVPQTRTLTINGVTYNLAADRSWTIAAGVSSVTATTPLFSTGGVNPDISIQQSSSSLDGYLSSTDWLSFNSKQPAGNYITSLTGEAIGTGPGATAVTLSNAAVIGKLLTGLNITGSTISSSDSILTAFGKVQNQINGLVGGVQYQGVWNANTNTPTLVSSVGTQGYYYIVSIAGNTNLNGITDWQIGDWAIFNGSTWNKVDNTDLVTSVNGQVGAVSLTTDNIPEGATNLYYLDSRARAALSFAAGSGAYNSTTGVITIPTDNSQILNGAGYITLVSLSATSPLSYNNATGAFSIQVANTTQNGYLSSTDWNTFNGKQDYLNGTGLVKSVAGVISYITDNSANWNTAYNDSIVSAAVTGTATKTLTLNQQDGGTITASWSDIDTGLTSVGVSMPSAFSVANSPLTANGTIAVTGAGVASQYIRGDGTLANFPTSGGGGSSVAYYFNSSVSQGTLGGVAYRELSKVPIIGAGTDITIATNGYIANYITDAGDPSLLEIPAGNWNFEMFFSASSGGGSPSFYVQLYKYDGTTFTLISSSSATPEGITNGTAIDLYTTALAVPLTTLTLTDRLAIRVYVNNSGRTITLHTENSHLCEVITTFSTGIAALNGLTAQVQYFQVGTSGTDFNISSTTATHTFNIPDASATARGLITTGTQTIVGDKTFTGTSTFRTNNFENAVEIKDNTSYSVDSGFTTINTERALTVSSVGFNFGSTNKTSKFNFTNTANYQYTFPAATGTLALTSDLTGYVPYTGATANVDLGNYSLTSYGVNSKGTIEVSIDGTSSGSLTLRTGTSGLSYGTNAISLVSSPTNANTLSLYFNASSLTKQANISANSLTATRTYTLPDASGTIALTSDIPSLTGYVPYTGATTNVDLGTNSITLFNITSNSVLIVKNTGSVTGTNGFSSFSGNIANNGFTFAPNNSSYHRFIVPTSSNYDYTLPSASGTIALVGGSGVGTVTSVGLSSATSGVTIGSSPVTTSGTITIAIATATTSQNGLLSSTDWTTFNSKGSGTVTSVAALTIGTSGTDLSSSVATGTTTPVITLNVPTASAANRGALSSADWTTFNNKQSALTNPVTGTGTTNYLPKFTGTSTIGNSLVYDNGTNVGINTTSPSAKFTVNGTIFSDNNGLNNFALNSVGTNYGFIQNDAADKWSLGTGTVLSTLGTPVLTWHKNGNVTIGTTTDSGYKLDVNGTGRFSGNTYIGGNFSIGAVPSATTTLLLSFTSAVTDAIKMVNTATSGGTWYIGDGSGIGNSAGTLGIANSSGTAVLKIASTGAATFSSSVTATSAIINNGVNSTDGIKVISSTTASVMTGGIEFMRTTVTGGSKIEPLRDAAIGGVGLKFLVTANNTAEINATYTSALQILNTGAATFSSSIAATSLLLNGGSLIGNFTINGGTGDTTTQNAIQTFTRTTSTGNVLAGKIVLVAGADATNYGNLVLRVKSSPSSGESDAYYTNALTLAGTTGAATFSSTLQAGTGTFLTTSTTPLIIQTTGGNCGMQMLTSTTTTNWLVAAQYSTANTFEITPSTTVGGTTYSTPALKILNTGIVTINGASTTYGILAVKANNTTNYGGILAYANGNSNWCNITHNGTDGMITTDYAAGGSYTGMAFQTTATTRLYITSGGNVLIGTTTDAGYKLYVDGGSSNGMAFYSTSAANQFKIAGEAAAMTFSNTITGPTMGGSLGVATSAGQFLSGTAAGDTIFINQFTGKKLYITNYSGGVYLTQGATSWTANSDIRLKNINSHIENAIEKLSTLQTINFSYKDDKTNKQNLGLIAQEVEKIFPELIDKNGDGMLGVRYTELVPVLIKAIQELKLEIETLKNK